MIYIMVVRSGQRFVEHLELSRKLIKGDSASCVCTLHTDHVLRALTIGRGTIFNHDKISRHPH